MKPAENTCEKQVKEEDEAISHPCGKPSTHAYRPAPRFPNDWYGVCHEHTEELKKENPTFIETGTLREL